MKKYLFAGFIILLPIALTFMIVSWLFNFFTLPLAHLAENILVIYDIDLKSHQILVFFLSRAAAIVLLFLIILTLGFFGRKYFFDTLLRYTNLLFLRIPFVKSVYRIAKEVTKALFSQETKAFKQTVLVPFPHQNVHTLAFITSDAPAALKEKVTEIDKAVFVPTAPHPLSGYMLFSSKKGIKEVDISVEEAFKFLLSCGTAHPGANPSDQPKN